MNPKKRYYSKPINERKSDEAVMASRKRDHNWRTAARMADRTARLMAKGRKP